MRYLSVAEILATHDYQIQRFGGTHGVLNLPLLESAVSRPKTNISGTDMYNTLYEKAAVLAYSLIKNHPFLDGNKRTGLHATLTFMELNGFRLHIDSKQLVKLGLAIAKDKMAVDEITKFFVTHSTEN